jgi:HEAT repeat protein
MFKLIQIALMCVGATLVFAEPGAAERGEVSYQVGMKALDAKQWQNAIAEFEGVPPDNARAGGALYWKAYALNKLGRRQEALTAIGQLRKQYARSQWVNDAKALEIEVRQAAGQTVSPEAESDEELKLMAINSLMNSDPERGIPLLEGVLKGNHSLKLKQQALFVLLQTGSPRARQIATGIAKDNSNPELQKKAIEDLGIFGGPESLQILSDIYASSTDVGIKHRILQSFMVAGDRGRILAAAKGESSPELRRQAIELLGVMGNETAPDILALYASGRDKSDRKAAIQALFVQGNDKALIDLARKETDPELKRHIVQQLSVMGTKDATDYMMEILNK